MLDEQEIAVRRLDRLDVSPLAAFARLRSYTPGRAAFLIEPLGPETDEAGRFAIVGYRVKSCSLMPPGVDAVAAQAEAIESLPEPESYAAAVALGAVGFFSSSVANGWQRVRLHEDDGPAACFAFGATVMVFDRKDGSCAVAGPQKGKLVDRCLWELEHGKDPAPIPAGAGEPADVQPDASDDKIRARTERAKPFVAELQSLVLARTFTCPEGGADGFDCYRALRTTNQQFGYYIDFGESPMAARLQLCGVADKPLYGRAHGQSGAGLRGALSAVLPHPSMTGAPLPDALRVIRQLEDASRQTWGGVVGVLAAGGAAAFHLADEIIAVQHGRFWCTSGVALSRASQIDAAEATRAAAGARLRAIAVAHRAAKQGS